MLKTDERYVLNDNEIAAKVMDGEAILINLSSGVYYSLPGAGGLVWELLAAGRSVGEAAAALAERFDVAGMQAEIDVTRVAEELVAEGIVRSATRADSASREADLSAWPVGEKKLPYATVELQAYRDMSDLLALDPPMPTLDDVPWKEDRGE